jgi:hypothetical protein
MPYSYKISEGIIHVSSIQPEIITALRTSGMLFLMLPPKMFHGFENLIDVHVVTRTA